MRIRTLTSASVLAVLCLALGADAVQATTDDEGPAFAAVADDPADGDLVAQADADNSGRLPPAPRRNETDRSGSSVRAEQMIGDMLTTARRRDELVQRAPVAVSALDARRLDVTDVRRLSDLDGTIPSFSIDNALGAANTGRLTIRGVGQVETNSAFDPAVGVYVDGVYLARSTGLLAPLYDVERVEVVRGPQGTLFGKNTIGGAVNVITRKPEFEFGASGSVRAGNFRELQTRWTVNLPIVAERAAARVSLASNYDDGYQKNVFRDERLGNDRLLGGRSELLLLPSDSVEVMLAGEYTREDRRPRAGKCVVVGDPDPIIAAVEGDGPNDMGMSLADAMRDTCAADANRSEFKGSSDFGALDDLESTTLASTITWDLGSNVMLRSITAFHYINNDAGQDLDASPLNLAQPPFKGGTLESRTRSQELQLTGRAFDERFVYVFGLFGFDEDIEDDIPVGSSLIAPELQKRDLFGSAFIPIVREKRKIDNRSYAGYAQASFALTDKLTLSAGLRRTLDRRSLSKQDVTTGINLSPTGKAMTQPAGINVFSLDRSERFGDWSPNATLSYQVTPKVLTYASYATGFRSGGFNGRATALNMDRATIDPEDLTTYEVGAKTTFLEDRLLVNVAQFYSIYSDIQRPILQKASPIPVPTVVTRNAAEARLHGTELELVALPFAGLRLESALSAFSARYTEFDSPMQPDIEDARLPGQPNYLMSFAVGYQRELGFGLWSTRVQWTHRGSQGNDTVDSDSISSNKYGLLDGRIAFELTDGKTEIALFGTNLLDRVYFTNGFDASTSVGVGVRFFGPPRRYGVEVKRAF